MSFGFLKAVPFVGSFYNTLAYRALVYGYSNARIKSMKSVLLDKKFFQDVLSASSISEIVSLLEKTSYKEDLAAASLEKISNEIDLIEFALAKNLNRTVSSLAKISPQEALPFLNTVFERYDVHNLKTVLLAKHLKQTPESAKKLLLKPVNVSEYKLNELLESGNVFEAVEKLRQTEYYNSLADALPEYKEKSEVVPLLQALDLFYFEK
ncbi:MAG: V-type ATPase subunit, partial [Candidatus Diapherotrites archaeon]|nr:V-type ATPase subunit [Candidatus Diapherotrites archaeon]